MTISINDLLGIPYKENGRDKSGMNCYGLAIEVARRYGYKLNDIVNENHDAELSNEEMPTLNVTPIDKPREGALLEMESKNELHVGICINSREFIHMTRSGCRVSQIGTVKVRGIYGIDTRL